jgi:hypothetical protein
MSSITRATNKIVDISKIGSVTDLSKIGNLGDIAKIDNLSLGKQTIADLNKIDNADFSAGTRINPRQTFTTKNALEVRKTASIIGDTQYVQRIDKQLDNIARITKVEDLADTPELQKAVTKLDAGENPKKGMTPLEAQEVDKSFKKLFDDIESPSSTKKKWSDLSDAEKSDRMQLYTKYAVGIAAVTALSAVLIKSRIDTDRINNTEYTITSITSKDKTISVTYEPKDKFSTRDSFTISESNSNPKIDGEYSIRTATNGKITFDGPSTITTNGNRGKMRVFTTFENQVSTNVQKTLRPVTQTVGDVVKDTVSTLYSSLLPEWLQDIFSKIWIVSLIFCILSSLVLSGFFVYRLQQ